MNLRLPEEILQAYKDLKAAADSEEHFHLKRKRQSQMKKLENILQLSCYGYNSSKNLYVLDM